MKKLSLAILAAVFTLSIYSCRETAEDTETSVEEVESDFERTGEEIESTGEEVGEEIEQELE